MELKKVLTIAGSDSSGGAGIQADIKTMTANGVYAMSAVTALTAQNTTGVTKVFEVEADFLALQLDAVFTDIFPDAVKIGMLPGRELIETAREKLLFYKAKNVVIDPVMVATSGDRLISRTDTDALKEKMLSLARLVTPNIPEAEVIAKMKITNKEDMEKAAISINERYGCSVLIKGGHLMGDASDVLLDDGEMVWFDGKRIKNSNSHGTGCTLSSAISANLAKGYDIKDAVRLAKEYVSKALSDMLNLGKGSGPLNHMFDLKSKFMQ